MSEHRVKVENGKYEFVQRGGFKLDVLRYGEPWIEDLNGSKAIGTMMVELDAARVVLAAVRANVKQLNGTDAYPAWAVDAMALHDRLVDDREPPSTWCGTPTDEQRAEPTVTSEERLAWEASKQPEARVRRDHSEQKP